MFVRCPTYLHLYPCTLPTAPVSRSFGLRSSYEIDILDTNQRPRNKSLRLLICEFAEVKSSEGFRLPPFTKFHQYDPPIRDHLPTVLPHKNIERTVGYH
jgi:hypothetical protein